MCPFIRSARLLRQREGTDLPTSSLDLLCRYLPSKDCTLPGKHYNSPEGTLERKSGAV